MRSVTAMVERLASRSCRVSAKSALVMELHQLFVDDRFGEVRPRCQELIRLISTNNPVPRVQEIEAQMRSPWHRFAVRMPPRRQRTRRATKKNSFHFVTDQAVGWIAEAFETKNCLATQKFAP
jgi:hypothetical protein